MAQTATVAVIRANAIRTGGAEAKTHYGCDLVIEDGIVAGVDIEIDATGYIVVPGLVNCHTHAGCTLHARGCLKISISPRRSVLSQPHSRPRSGLYRAQKKGIRRRHGVGRARHAARLRDHDCQG